MKLRVVGWAYYDDDMEQGDIGWAARNAIIDDIKAHGYLFSGWAHQECDCCAPVLNDGKLYCFSQRGWGGVMAEAHGYNGRMDYARFAFAMDAEDEIRPKYAFDEDTFVPEYDLNQRFELQVSNATFDQAQSESKVKFMGNTEFTERKVVLDDLPELRYLDEGDTLALVCGQEIAEYTVLDVERKRDLTEEKRWQLELDSYAFDDPDRMKRADEEFDNAKIVMIVKLSKSTN